MDSIKNAAYGLGHTIDPAGAKLMPPANQGHPVAVVLAVVAFEPPKALSRLPAATAARTR
jgi:hypothetical protein